MGPPQIPLGWALTHSLVLSLFWGTVAWAHISFRLLHSSNPKAKVPPGFLCRSVNPGAETFIKMQSVITLVPKNPEGSGTAFLSQETVYIGNIDIIWVITVLESPGSCQVSAVTAGRATESQGRRGILCATLCLQQRHSPTQSVLL